MTTTITISTHDWPVEVKTKDALGGGEFAEQIQIVNPNSTRVVHLHATRSVELTELPKPVADEVAK